LRDKGDPRPTIVFQNNYFSHETGDKLTMVLLENINEIQGMKFYDHCGSNQDAKRILVNSK
jgi:hypothetical protein